MYDFNTMTVEEGIALVSETAAGRLQKQADLSWDSLKHPLDTMQQYTDKIPWDKVREYGTVPAIMAGAGGLAGLASSSMDDKERRKPIRSMLGGALLGGGAGAAIPLIKLLGAEGDSNKIDSSTTAALSSTPVPSPAPATPPEEPSLAQRLTNSVAPVVDAATAIPKGVAGFLNDISGGSWVYTDKPSQMPMGASTLIAASPAIGAAVAAKPWLDSRAAKGELAKLNTPEAFKARLEAIETLKTKIAPAIDQINNRFRGIRDYLNPKSIENPNIYADTVNNMQKMLGRRDLPVADVTDPVVRTGLRDLMDTFVRRSANPQNPHDPLESHKLEVQHMKTLLDAAEKIDPNSALSDKLRTRVRDKFNEINERVVADAKAQQAELFRGPTEPTMQRRVGEIVDRNGRKETPIPEHQSIEPNVAALTHLVNGPHAEKIKALEGIVAKTPTGKRMAWGTGVPIAAGLTWGAANSWAAYNRSREAAQAAIERSRLQLAPSGVTGNP